MSRGDVERQVLEAVVHLGDNAYGVTIRERVNETRDALGLPDLSFGSIYAALARLELKGSIKHELADSIARLSRGIPPEPDRNSNRRGGRPRLYFRPLPPGNPDPAARKATREGNP